LLGILKTQATLFAALSVLGVLIRTLPKGRVLDFLENHTLRLQFSLGVLAGIAGPVLYIFLARESPLARVVPLLAGLALIALSLLLAGAVHRVPLPWHEAAAILAIAALLQVGFSARPFADFLVGAGLLLVIYAPARTIVIIHFPESWPVRTLGEIGALLRLSRSELRIILGSLPVFAYISYSRTPKDAANRVFAIIAAGIFLEIVVFKALYRRGHRYLARWVDWMDPLFERFHLDFALAVSGVLNRKFRIGTGLLVDLLNTKANTYARSRRYREALELAERSHEVWIRASRPATLWSLQAVSGLAGFLGNVGNLDRAESVLREGIAAFRARPNKRAVPEYGEMLTTLGKVLLSKGQIEGAERLCREGLDVLRTHLGYGRMETLSALASLQVCLAQTGEIEELDEEQLDYLGAAFENALVLRRFTDLALWYYHSLGASYLRKGQYPEARKAFLRELLIERSLVGRRSVGLTSTYLQLAITAAARLRPRKALCWMQRLVASEEHGTTAIFSVSDESHRLRYVRRFALPVSISVALALLHDEELGDRGRTAAFIHAIRRKGLVAESMLWQEHLRPDCAAPDVQAALQEWHQIQKAMATGQEIPEGAVRRERELATWIENEFPELRLEERLRRVDWNSFQSELPSDVTLIEFVRVRSVAFDPAMNGGETFGPARYAAFFVTKGNAPKLLDIGPAQVIDQAVGQRIVNVREPHLYPSAQTETWRLLGAPIASMCPAGTRLIIAPDGELNRFPFEILRDPASEASPYFLTKYQISYVNCGRDLLRYARRRIASREWRSPLFVAVEQFRRADESAPPELPSGLRSAPPPAQFHANKMKFEPLPGAAREVRLIRSSWGGAVLLNEDVTEARLRRELGQGGANGGGPCILHFATHGWVMGRSESEADNLNALRRVGLALFAGQFTGMDVLACDLRHTELVVLSCCNTGLGDLSYSEGVLGLQRAFLLSGAATIVMSLWNVDDAVTCLLMKDFYGYLLAGESRAGALNKAKAWLAGGIFSDPIYWAGFILQGDDKPLPQDMPRPFSQR
jgi:CHAT domain-containing protein/tetratricopeptide (TPR) repeat protein